MLKILFYIMYRGWKIENPSFNLRSLYRLQVVFVAQQCMFFIILFLMIIEEYIDTKFLNWTKLLTYDIKNIRLFIMIFVISTITIYNYYSIFKRGAREHILSLYEGKFKTLIKYHLLIFALLLSLPLILFSVLDKLLN